MTDLVSYDEAANHRYVFSPCASIRRRPGMYIGDTDNGDGLLHLLTGVLLCSAGATRDGVSEVVVTRHADGAWGVEDNGRGVGLGLFEALTQMPRGAPRTLGVYTLDGLVIAHALSELFHVETRHRHQVWRQEFARGEAVTPPVQVGYTDRSGLRLVLRPDREIFSEVSVSMQALHQWLAWQAMVWPTQRFILHDEVEDRRHVFCAPGGLMEEALLQVTQLCPVDAVGDVSVWSFQDSALHPENHWLDTDCRVCCAWIKGVPGSALQCGALQGELVLESIEDAFFKGLEAALRRLARGLEVTLPEDVPRHVLRRGVVGLVHCAWWFDHERVRLKALVENAMVTRLGDHPEMARAWITQIWADTLDVKSIVSGS